jgi:hypothetical protein
MSNSSQVSGFWRRIKLHPAHGVVSVGLEDDYHRFLLKLCHADGVITAVDTHAERFPWSTCADAGAFLTQQAVGLSMDTVARLDPRSHCTHLFDLLILCAAHAGDAEPTQFDMRVDDRVGEQTAATLSENGTVVLRWDINGTLIESPDGWAGRDLRHLSSWKTELPAVDVERALLLRRAVYVSGGRRMTDQLVRAERASDRGPSRLGVCFTYQMPRVLDAFASPDWVRDFSGSQAQPLQFFDPQTLSTLGD